jgi:hypothetical protein
MSGVVESSFQTVFRRCDEVRNHLMEATTKTTAQGKKRLSNPGSLMIPSRRQNIGSRLAGPTIFRDTTVPRKRAANGFMCIQQIRTLNQIHLKLLRRPKACGTILTLMCVRRPCGYSQSCATLTLQQLLLIRLSKITTPKMDQ